MKKIDEVYLPLLAGLQDIICHALVLPQFIVYVCLSIQYYHAVFKIHVCPCFVCARIRAWMSGKAGGVPPEPL